MNIKSEQLHAALRRELAPLYVVQGDDPLLTLEAADEIRKAARDAGYAERELFLVEGAFDWNALLHSGNNLSLFGARRLLEVRIPSGKPGTEGAKALQRYVADLPQDTVTLVMLPKLDRQSQNTAWFKAVAAAAVSVTVYPVERARLPHWIRDRLARQNQSVDANALQFLADRVEGNLLAARQEIQKLALLLPEGNLTFDAVKEAVLDVARYDVFRLSEAVLLGDAARALRTIRGLQAEGEAPTLVLWVLSNEVRTLLQIHQAMKKGQPMSAAMAAARVWDARQPAMRAALGRLPEALLLHGLTRAAALDRMVKGLRAGDPWDELAQLALLLTLGRELLAA